VSVCFGEVLYVRRRWVSKVSRYGDHGNWTHWACIKALGKERLASISGAFFRELVKRGAKRRADCARHPGIGAAPPTKVVKA
jgi:hypothetical protein